MKTPDHPLGPPPQGASPATVGPEDVPPVEKVRQEPAPTAGAPHTAYDTIAPAPLPREETRHGPAPAAAAARTAYETVAPSSPSAAPTPEATVGPDAPVAPSPRTSATVADRAPPPAAAPAPKLPTPNAETVGPQARTASPEDPYPGAASPPTRMDEDSGSANDRSSETRLTLSATEPSVAPGRRHDAVAPPGYEVLGELGRGGMGVVYKARQVGLNRLVALKMILRAGHASHDQLIRFRIEAEAIAGLRHPNVVQVFEVGEHDGVPFFSLEFVPGGTLADHLGGTPQPPRLAAQVLRVLADAVDAAHRQGIIHRDLKPANVLLDVLSPTESAVDRAGAVPHKGQLLVPKITDFGLAKRLGEDEADGPTREGAIMGTPNYMAPEQAQGKTREIGPGADVYALGAILYDLLTGHPPFRGDTVMDTLQQVIAADPPPPTSIQARVPRDLETICLKCLHKDPAQRYPCARDLGEDLRRYLDGEPILARPTSTWERAVKWVRRRPAVAALTAVTALAVLGGTCGVVCFAIHEKRHALEETGLRQEAEVRRHQAEASFRVACAAVDRMLARVGRQKLAHEPHMEGVRRALLEDALHFYEGFLREKETDPEVRWQTGRTCLRLGEIQQMLGRQDEAGRQYRRAVALLEPLTDEHPDEPHYRADLALCHYRQGLLAFQEAQLPAAEKSYRQARTLQEGLSAHADAEPEHRQALAATLRELGLVLQQRGQARDAEAVYREAETVAHKLAEAFPAQPEYRQDRARALGLLGHLFQSAGRADDARRSYRTARDLLAGLAGQRAAVPEYRQELVLAWNDLGLVERDTHPKEAEAAYRKAVALADKLVNDFPATPQYRQLLAASLGNLGVLLQATGRAEAAETAFGRALGLKEKLADTVPWVADYRRDLAAALNNRGIQLQTQQRLDESATVYERAVQVLRKLCKDAPDTPEYGLELARARLNQGALFQNRGRGGDAETAYREAVTLLEGLAERLGPGPAGRLELARAWCNLGVALQLAGRAAEAEKAYRSALDRLAALVKEYPDVPDHRHQQALAAVNLANLLRDTKRGGEAEPLWTQARDLLDVLARAHPEVPAYQQQLARTLNEWGIYLAGAKRPREARRLLEQALNVYRPLAQQSPAESTYVLELARTEANLGVMAATENRQAQAEEHYRRAIAGLEALPVASRGPDTRRELATQYTNLAVLLGRTGPPQEEEKALRRLVEERRALAEAAPATVAGQSELAAAEHALARRVWHDHRTAEARTLLEDAVRRQEQARKAAPTQAAYREQLLHHHAELIEVLLGLGDHVAAARSLEDLLALVPPAWPQRPQAAAYLGRCARLAAKEDKRLAAERERLVRQYGDRAVALLREAVKNGFRDRKMLDTNEDFAPLRDRPDFRKLVKDLGGS